MPRPTEEKASAFGVAVVSWVVACGAVAYEGSPIRPALFVRLAALALALLGVVALFATKSAREARAEATALGARRNELALELMGTRNKFMHTAESVRVGRSMRVRPTDVFVVTYPKCGTTWMNNICHALRSGGALDYGEITEVCPWDILAHDCGQDLDADHVAEPRVFKSHESWATIAKGGKYIYVARDPLDAFVSFHKFLPAYTGLRADDLDEETFARAIFAGASHSGQVWDHMRGWWEQRHASNVLWVFFEDLVSDLRTQIERVAQFMGVDADDEDLISTALNQASFDFMSSTEHAHHFDDHFVRRHILPKMALDPNAPLRVSKVRKGGGTTGSRRELPVAVSRRLHDKWQAVLAGPTGCQDYAALREQLHTDPRILAGDPCVAA